MPEATVGSAPAPASASACRPEPDTDGSLQRLHEIVLQWAARTPGAPAITEGDCTWTYADLLESVMRAAGLLADLGIGPGDRVMLVGENGLALVSFILAAGVRNACAVMENARRAPAEVDRIRQHCDARRTLYLTGNSPDAAAHAARAGAAAVRDARLGALAYGEERPEALRDAVAGTRDDVAVLIYTTGTTGEPKGVMLTHANLLFLSRRMVQLRQVTPADRVYGVLPVTHVMGLAGALCGTLRAGAHLFIVARFEARQCIEALRAHGISMLQGAPAMFAKLGEQARQGPLEAPRMRFIAAGGAPIDAAAQAAAEAAFPGLTLHNGYGLTEGSGLCWTRMDDPRTDDSVGPALPGVELQLRDARGRPVPEGTEGELWVRGPQIMKGYYRNPERTAQALRDGWFNTEDLARIDPHGNVFIVGRTKDLIISGGFNVYPLEVEVALNAHPSIVQAAVVGRRNGASEDVVAFIELADGGRLTGDELRAHLQPRISPYKRPRETYVMAALPCSPNGKVLKSVLRQMLDAQDAGLQRLQ